MGNKLAHRLRLESLRKRLQLRQKLLHRLVSLKRGFPKNLVENTFEFNRTVREKSGERRGFLRTDTMHQARGSVSRERTLVAQQLEQEHSERPNIRTFVGMFPLVLLWGHIGECA